MSTTTPEDGENEDDYEELQAEFLSMSDEEQTRAFLDLFAGRGSRPYPGALRLFDREEEALLHSKNAVQVPYNAFYDRVQHVLFNPPLYAPNGAFDLVEQYFRVLEAYRLMTTGDRSKITVNVSRRVLAFLDAMERGQRHWHADETPRV